MSDRRRSPRSRTRRHDSRHRVRNRSQSRERIHSRSRTPSFRGFEQLMSTLNTIVSRISALENANNVMSVHTATAVPPSVNNSESVRTLATPRPSSRQSSRPPSRSRMNEAPTGCSAPPNSLDNVATADGSVNETVRANVDEGMSNSSTAVQPEKENGAVTSTPAQDLIEAIKSLKPTRNQNYYVSNFDPAIHDIATWCKEVERAKFSNGWDDYECLSRVANCLKGDARTWLQEWVSNDRSWRNFVLEFQPLCPRRLDFANIIFETMNTNSDKYATYADYARRTLLRLRIVKGLSEELMVLIVIRGITDPQVRAAAANANLRPDTLVPFLSIYVKPGGGDSKSEARAPQAKKRPSEPNKDVECYNCHQTGHKSFKCPKKSKTHDDKVAGPSSSEPSTDKVSSKEPCSFCKKPGHTEQNCFAKNGSGPRNKRNVNLCMEQSHLKTESDDLVMAVVQGIPIDVLIDSGALNVSLVSSNVLKYVSHTLKPVNCTLTGIGNREIIADSYVTLTIEFSEISIEADFVVVPSQFMNIPIIVGTDILNRDGVTFTRTKGRQYLTRSTDMPRRVSAVISDLNSINSHLQGEKRELLMSVLGDCSEFLITGTATTMTEEGILREVLKTLTEAGFSVNLRKCSFLTTEVEYLGRVISQGQVRPSSHKVEALINAQPYRAAWREMCRSRASELLGRNRSKQGDYVNERRCSARTFQVGDLVFAIRYSQSTGKLYSGMKGPYKITKVLPSGRYELKLLSGAYGKTTQAAAEYLVLWRGEWCPESCAAFFENTEAVIPSVDQNTGAGPSTAPPAVAAPDAAPALPGVAGLSMHDLEALPEEEDRRADSMVEGAVEDDSRSGEAVL